MALDMRRGGLQGLLVGVAGVALTSLLTALPAWQGLEGRAQASALSGYGRTLHPDVVLLTTDDRAYFSEAMVGIHREHTGRLLAALEKAGAKAIALDLFYGRASEFGPADDAAFGQSLKPLRRVVIASECVVAHSQADHRNPWALPEGPLPANRCQRFALPYGALRDLVATSHIQLANSPAGFFHSVHLFAESAARPNERLPHLALTALALGQDLSPKAAIEQRPDGAQVGRYFVPATDGKFRVSLSWPAPGAHVSIVDVFTAIEGQDDPQLPGALAARFAGKYVFIGRSAESLGDWGPFSDGDRHPLVLLHATALSDILFGYPVWELPVPFHPLLCFAVGLSLVFAALLLRPQVAGFALAMALLAVIGLTAEGVRRGLVFPPLGPSLAAAAGFSFALWGRSAARERERRLLTSAFGAYVDQALLTRILEKPEQYLALGGARRRLTVLFSDLAGYTTLSNQKPAEEVIAFMRDYLEVMTTVIRSHGGRIDKIMGDGIMAVFGDPQFFMDHASRAVGAALEMQLRIAEVNARWGPRGWPLIRMRVGVATGEVFVGNIGSAAKLEYTVLGSTVNLASRLEGQAKPGSVLCSEETRLETAGRFVFTPRFDLELKGFEGSTTAYVARPLGSTAGSES